MRIESSDPSRYDIIIQKALSGPRTLLVGLAWLAFGMRHTMMKSMKARHMFRGKVSLEGGGYGH